MELYAQLAEDVNVALYWTELKVGGVATTWREYSGDSWGIEALMQCVIESIPRSNTTISQRLWCTKLHDQFRLVPIECPTKFALSLRVVGWRSAIWWILPSRGKY
jgi:hypothetical protein